jgi:hypothetical protein
MERRDNLRFRLRAEVVFSWESSQGKRFQGEGYTRDLSVGGAYLYTSTCPPLHSRIQVDVMLPRVQLNAPAVVIRAPAGVVRLEHNVESTSPSGFAVAIEMNGGDRFELVQVEDGRNLPDPSEDRSR